MNKGSWFLLVTLLGVVAQASSSWKQLSRGPWHKREGHMAVSFKDYIWIIGGRDDIFFFNDIWRSRNGDSWEKITDNAPFGKRSYHTMTVFNGAIYIMGGQTLLKFYNDVWKSEDGINWHQVTDAAPWAARAGLASVVYKDELYMIGGGYNNIFRKVLNDVWKTSDGVRWEQVTPAADFAPRSGARLLDHNGKLLVLAGEHGFSNDTQFHDVWATEDGLNWEQVLGEAPWRNRSGHGVVQYKGDIYLMAGFIGLHDLWKSADGGASWSLIDDQIWNCAADDVKCGRYDFWSLIHQNEQGANLLVAVGGSSSPTTFFQQYDDTWVYDLDNQANVIILHN